MNSVQNDVGHAQFSPGFNAALFGIQPEQSVMVHTLGHFAVEVDGEPFSRKRAAQQKPLEFLQAIISLGGKNISSGILGTSLWPDAEGDAAANSIDINLHRVRKLLGYKDAITVCAGRYTLNNERVWVDAWAFERMLNTIEECLNAPLESEVQATDIERLMNDALSLYHGGFLSMESVKPWNVSIRERLRYKLLRFITEVTRLAEDNSHWSIAIRFYLKGLEIEPFAEELYQCLMICYQNAGRRAEALATYQRCRTNLSNGLNLTPSKETERIRSSIY